MVTSNQKEVLFREIFSYIKKYQVKSLLDIGAGDGPLAKRLAGKVSEYLAVERDSRRAKNLRSLGLNVIHGTFPVKTGKKFDMVLVSHSIPENATFYKPFLKRAWNLVNGDGILLIITFKGQLGELYKLRREWRATDSQGNRDMEPYKLMLKILRSFGGVKIHRAVSEFKSTNLAEIVKLTMLSVGPAKAKRQACKQFLGKFLKDSRRSRKPYTLSHQHIFLSVRNKKGPATYVAGP
ncbi:MAG: class I SAM-dependent methyltransferase [Minisyncoccia bacterium]